MEFMNLFLKFGLNFDRNVKCMANFGAKRKSVSIEWDRGSLDSFPSLFFSPFFSETVKGETGFIVGKARFPNPFFAGEIIESWE